MRFHNGVPETQGFTPQDDARWSPLDEPSQQRFLVWAMLWSLPWSALLVGAWLWPLFAQDASHARVTVPPWTTLLSLPVMMVVHELLHMLAHPGAGTRRESVLGAIPAQGMLFAAYLGEMSRGRLIFILLTPLSVITGLPWMLCMALGQFSGYWAALSLLNGLISIGDVMGVWLLLRGTPAGAVVRNQGWQTWWRRLDAR
ncbi:Putative zincin peptidase [Pseudoxanthomonas sp. GM95]|uniref:DUF3267 domain-containing protein n=1 Tax=Pseudoxanthomonas sp. GM95 TaxID=1881043 RepID=UPI0008AFBF06|nr:DUF3267 domain-containing protein [Pseudoxanthomonas sp. GM95]SEL83975.1 Putative zincin peptidase [Pseudoxanthomonas sp. GM95]